MQPPYQLLEKGTLAARAATVTRQALAAGALQPIATDFLHIEDAGARFLVRTLANRNAAGGADLRTPGERGIQPNFNPFLPYDLALFVADLTPTHLCLLNKFTVIDHHLLIVTREFVDQEERLTRADFAALWLCLDEIDGLGFYNSGKVAGASQRHKHLQLAPFPLDPEGAAMPIAPLLAAAPAGQGIQRVPVLPFVHAFAWLPQAAGQPPSSAQEESWRLYGEMLRQVGAERTGGQRPVPYNLLITREWMLLVPRGRERWESISVNALGFAGCLLVRGPAELAALHTVGPLGVLRFVVDG